MKTSRILKSYLKGLKDSKKTDDLRRKTGITQSTHNTERMKLLKHVFQASINLSKVSENDK